MIAIFSRLQSMWTNTTARSPTELELNSLTEKNQEGWLSTTDRRASVSAISLRHNLATSRESKTHYLAIPGYATGTIAVNVTYGWKEDSMLVKRIANVPIYIFNRFPVIQPVNSKVRHFCTFWPPWDNRGKWCMGQRGFNAGQTNRSMCTHPLPGCKTVWG